MLHAHLPSPAEAVPYFVTSLWIPILTVLLNLCTTKSGHELPANKAVDFVLAKIFNHTGMSGRGGDWPRFSFLLCDVGRAVALIIGGFSMSTAFSKYGFEVWCARTQLARGRRGYSFTTACTVDDRRVVSREAPEILPAAVPLGHHGRLLVPVHVDLQRGCALAVHIHHRPHYPRLARKVEIHQVRTVLSQLYLTRS